MLPDDWKIAQISPIFKKGHRYKPGNYRPVSLTASIDVIYMDFMKAFDKVPHLRLLIKLQSYGICNKTLDWIKAFLAGRHQRVVVNGHMSEWSEVTSGIPQGSFLGPPLFMMFINDLPKTVQCGVKLFADDTKVYVRSDIPGNPDCLQNDITRLQD